MNDDITLVRAAHPDPSSEGLTAYDVYAGNEHIGQVWQTRTVTFGRPESTGFKNIHHVDWARTGTNEVESTRKGAVSSLHHQHQTSGDNDG